MVTRGEVKKMARELLLNKMPLKDVALKIKETGYISEKTGLPLTAWAVYSLAGVRTKRKKPVIARKARPVVSYAAVKPHHGGNIDLIKSIIRNDSMSCPDKVAMVDLVLQGM